MDNFEINWESLINRELHEEGYERKYSRWERRYKYHLKRFENKKSKQTRFDLLNSNSYVLDWSDNY